MGNGGKATVKLAPAITGKQVGKICDKGVCLIIQDEGNDQISYYATNDNFQDIDLTATGFSNLDASDPQKSIIPPNTTTPKKLFTTKITDSNKDTQFGSMKFFFGNPNASSDGTLYALPWAKGDTHKCTQGFNGSTSHTGELSFAGDFDLKTGTSVSAGRDGVVAITKQDATGTKPIAAKDMGNFVGIRHKDGTYSYYLHLKTNGVKVKAGDNVSEGQVIADSDNTGSTNGEHLHFDVRIADGNGSWKTIKWQFKDKSGSGLEPKVGADLQN
jgi:murein DD-endopeptidase MepM/ murein hydrolase activator NlpD